MTNKDLKKLKGWIGRERRRVEKERISCRETNANSAADIYLGRRLALQDVEIKIKAMEE